MTDAEINLALALKIGYLPEHVVLVRRENRYVVNRPSEWITEYWSAFDYTDWNTIMPIAEKYSVIGGTYEGKWSEAWADSNDIVFFDESLQRAIALAVLGVQS